MDNRVFHYSDSPKVLDKFSYKTILRSLVDHEMQYCYNIRKEGKKCKIVKIIIVQYMKSLKKR